jgi:SAM-dependent methyltransferase
MGSFPLPLSFSLPPLNRCVREHLSAESILSTPLPPQWQLPEGVPGGVWEYTQAAHIAAEYDEYFAENSLFEFDEQVLLRHIRRPGLAVDLGCGTGRAVVALARRGIRSLAVDLSPHMLSIVAEKARRENLPIQCVQANFV